MSFSNQTPHYGLPQWTADDTISFKTDINQAYETIDKNLYSAAEKADAAKTSADESNSTLATVKQTAESASDVAAQNRNELNTVNQAIKELTDRVEQLESAPPSSTDPNAATKSELAALQEQVTANEVAAGTNETNISQSQKDITSLQGTAESIQNAITELQKLTSNITVMVNGSDVKSSGQPFLCYITGKTISLYDRKIKSIPLTSLFVDYEALNLQSSDFSLYMTTVRFIDQRSDPICTPMVSINGANLELSFTLSPNDSGSTTFGNFLLYFKGKPHQNVITLS